MRLIVSLLGAIGLVVAAHPAFADGGRGDQSTADGIASQIDRVAPASADTTRAPVERRSGQIKAVGEGLSIRIPNNNAGKVELERPGSEINSHLGIGLPSGGDVKDAVIARGGTVTYQHSLKAADVAVQPFKKGVRVVTVIQGDKAPSEFVYPVDVPAGGSMKVGQDGGVLVVDARGLPRGGFTTPWAKDNQGRDVATHYELRGNTIVQVVSHHGAAYPVVADPWLWMNLIQDARWVFDTAAKGFTLKVTPTTWARVNAGSYLVGVAGWNELYSKYKDVGRRIRTNINGMRDQYICHQQFVALRSPRKSTWNLDEWRPDVGYLKTVNASCNPGGRSEFD